MIIHYHFRHSSAYILHLSKAAHKTVYLAGCQVRVVQKSMSEHLESAAKDHVDIFVRHCAEQKQSLEKLKLLLHDVTHEAVDIKAKNESMEENLHHLKKLLDLRCEDNVCSDCEVLYR